MQLVSRFPSARRAGAGVAAGLFAASIVSSQVIGLEQASATSYARYRVAYTGGQGISARTSPTAAPGAGYGAPEAAVLDVQCQVNGQPVGAHGNTLYFLVNYSGRSFYAPDAYTDSPHLAGQPPIAGIPICGSAPAPSPAPAPATLPAVWIGSPVNGTWAWYSSSLPANHHTPYGGDWSVDEPTAAGTPVVFYAAPQNTSIEVTARVDSVELACASGSVGDGGHRVTVGIYTREGARIGWVAFAHLDPSVSAGQTISRWGATLGTVGSYNTSSCWDGSHVHVEPYNEQHYACYNRGFSLRQQVYATNFIGFVGGNFAGSAHTACP